MLTTPAARAPLDPELLAATLVAPAGPLARLDVVARSGSTNTDLVAAVAAEPSAWQAPALLVADHQDAGRGRAGRVWHTPPRAALTSSLLVDPGVPPHRVPWLPLLVGLGVVRALRATTGLDAVLKWPNDVLLPAADAVDGWGPHRKVAGILCEGLPDGRAVLGVGINVSQGADELPVPSATSLALAGAATTDRGALLDAQVREVLGVLDTWRAAGGDARAARGATGGTLADEVADVCATLGVRVAVDRVDGSVLVGTVTGLGPDGELVVRGADGVDVPVVTGDVRHVRAENRTA
ncbi:biotin--[acetyl-CoA-carboxylase] ligase [Luteimicrobium subarcticum]|uniref:biotin--[biotin carboxyl-carrier protein] ligase n=1 Tax=Luteimicrobium subarcticum TaxID=620910 RepID=A0A2M8WUG7_9MICO|nr:biotin--[acetyl-CoA-carboxylase] ligase [Luteimicrobium subarcticum]PJI94563.1 BirA family biotin operon repressor/biotin-[acetyl-CoA-carboxylase] ligase [Luteimicrobium subarcticum]